MMMRSAVAAVVGASSTKGGGRQRLLLRTSVISATMKRNNSSANCCFINNNRLILHPHHHHHDQHHSFFLTSSSFTTSNNNNSAAAPSKTPMASTNIKWRPSSKPPPPPPPRITSTNTRRRQQQQQLPLLEHHQHAHGAPPPSPTTKRIQQWFDYKSSKVAKIPLTPLHINLNNKDSSASTTSITQTRTIKNNSAILINAKDKVLQQIMKKDKLFLTDLIHELLHALPVGCITPEIKDLVHLVMRSNSVDAITTEKLLFRLLKEEDCSATSNNNYNFRVTKVMYAMAMNAWAKQSKLVSKASSSKRHGNNSAAAYRAEKLLHLMQSRYDDEESNKTRAKPSVYNVTVCINAYANSSKDNKDGPKNAERLLHYATNILQIEPNIYTYTNVINAYAQHGLAEDAERLLISLEKQMSSKNLAAAASEAVPEAEAHEAGSNSAITSTKPIIIQPNVKTFTAVIRGWCNSNKGSLYGAKRAENVFDRLEHWYNKLQSNDLKPTRMTLITLMHAWEMVYTTNASSNSGSGGVSGSFGNNNNAILASDKVLSLYNRLQEYDNDDVTDGNLNLDSNDDNDNKWTQVSYTHVMDSLAKTGHPDIVENMLYDLLLLRKQQQQQHDNNNNTISASSSTTTTKLPLKGIQPTDKMWTIALYGWALRGNGEKTEKLLHQLNDCYKAGYVKTNPNQLLFYNMILLAWSKSSNSNSTHTHTDIDQSLAAASRAQSILDWMEEQSKLRSDDDDDNDNHQSESIKPDTASYNAVLTAWRRNVTSNPKAIEHILTLLQRMEDQYNDDDDDDLVLLQQQQQQQQQHQLGSDNSNADKNKLPNSLSFQIVMDALADDLRNHSKPHQDGDDDSQQQHHHHIQTSINMLKRIEKLHADDGLYDGRPILKTCAWTVNRNGELVADELIRRMESMVESSSQNNNTSMSSSSSSSVVPQISVASYDHVIGAWARSNNKDALIKANEYLQKMEGMYNKKTNTTRNKLQPSKFSYNYVLASSFVNRCNNDYDDCGGGNDDNSNDVNTYEKQMQVTRNVISRMRGGYIGGRSSVFPNALAFLKLYSDDIMNMNLSSKAAEEMINWLEDIDDDVDNDDASSSSSSSIEFLQHCYTYALQVCAYSSDDDAYERSDRLWERLMNECDNSDETPVPTTTTKAIPTLECLKLVLKVHDNRKDNKADAAERMEELVYSVEKKIHQNSNKDETSTTPTAAATTTNALLDTECYNMIVRKWSQSNKDGAPQRAWNILERMDNIAKKAKAQKKDNAIIRAVVIMMTWQLYNRR